MCFDQPGCDELPVERCDDSRYKVKTKCPIRCGLCQPEKPIETDTCTDTVET